MRHSVRLSLIAILCVCIAPVAQAIPQLINFQGILTDGLSNPITTTTSVQFRIWDMSAGGTELWMETQSITPDGNGQFSVLLGSSVPIPDSALAAVAAFLGITISPDPETSPRTQLVAVAYAFRTGTVDGASGGTITSKVSIGPSHINTGDNAFVAGSNNTASDDNATVSGGKSNTASGFSATVGGGRQNVATNTDAAVAGGLSNDATGLASVVSGGETNVASSSHTAVGGGHNNVASGSHTTISGGQNNTAEGDRATVGGGQWNWARGDYSVVAGGGGAATADSNSAIGFRSAVVGGNGNVASGQNSFVGGGKDNQSTGAWAAITAGSNNQATETSATVGGGGGNQATGLESTVSGGSVNGALAEEATVAGGAANMATGIGSAIGGGANNVAGGNRATVPGGRACEANGDHSFAAGRLAFAQHDGCFVWGDDRGIPANSFSTGPNQFIIFAEGGVGIETELPFNPTTTSTRLTMNGSIGFKNGTTGMLYVYESGSANAPRPVISHSPQFENWGLTWVDDGDKMVFQRGGSPVMSVDLGAFNVGIRVQDPTNILQVVQSSPTDPIADAWTVYSSRRWKKNIQTMDGALDKMLQLRGVTYDWKETGKSDIGLIAEEVGEVFPEIVAYEDNGIDAKSVDYARLVAVLIEANREQQAQLDEQRELIEQLAQRVQMIERP